jgi:hypothetical protein
MDRKQTRSKRIPKAADTQANPEDVLTHEGTR